MQAALHDLIRASVDRAEADVEVLMPGFTHLQVHPSSFSDGTSCSRMLVFAGLPEAPGIVLHSSLSTAI